MVVVVSAAVSQALHRNRERYNQDLGTLTDDEINERIRLANRSSSISLGKSLAGMLTSFGLTGLTIHYIGDGKSLYPVIPLLTGIVLAGYSGMQVLKLTNQCLLADEGERILKTRAEYRLSDEELQGKIREAERKYRKLKIRARIGSGATVAATVALNYAERKLKVNMHWEFLALYSGLIYSAVEYFRSVYQGNVADHERAILQTKRNAQ